MDITPFPEPIVGKEVLLAGFAKFTVRESLLEVLVKVPQFQQSDEIGRFVPELGV